MHIEFNSNGYDYNIFRIHDGNFMHINTILMAMIFVGVFDMMNCLLVSL